MDKLQKEFATALLDRVDRAARASEELVSIMDEIIAAQKSNQKMLVEILNLLKKPGKVTRG
jgi:hypothetical protein